MKNKIIFLFFFFSILTIAQRPSSTKKWNDYYNRYEYFDNQNKLIGYEKYNDYKNQWEYFEIDPHKSNSSRSNEAFDNLLASQERQLDRLYSQRNPINLSKQLEQSQASADYNHKVIQNTYNELIEKIKSSDLSIDEQEDFFVAFNKRVEFADDKFINIGNYDIALKKLNFIIDSFNNLMKDYSTKKINAVIQKVLELDSKFDSALINKVPKDFNFHTASYDEIIQSGQYSYVIREYVSARNSFSKLMNEGNLTDEVANNLYSKMLVEYYKVAEK